MRSAVAQRFIKSPRRELGDSGCECRPACVADPGSPNGPVSPGFHPGLLVEGGGRSNVMWRLVGAACLLAGVAATAAAENAPAARIVAARCLDCHDAATKEANLSLEGLDAAITPKNFDLWRKVLDELDTERMPQPDAERPTADERRAAVLDLEDRLAAHAKAFSVSTRPGSIPPTGFPAMSARTASPPTVNRS